MIQTIAGEAGREPPLGQAALAHVIFNRVADGGYGGDTVQDVVNAPVKPGSAFKQFTMWNAPAQGGNAAKTNLDPNSPDYARIGNIVDQVYNGVIPDPTNGATHYFAQGSLPANRLPAEWNPIKNTNVHRIAGQTFVGGSMGPGQTLPSQFTGGYNDAGESLT